MLIEYTEKPTDNNNRILEMLTEYDKEFIPPLSARSSTMQCDFSTEKITSSIPFEYYKKVMSQKMLVAKNGFDIAGFMSFVENYSFDVIDECDNIYISTVIVEKKYRRMGITSGFYKKLLEMYKGKNVVTRTWSTNVSHVGLLEKIGFSEFKRIKDDRGKGIDTVYYVYKN